jgi:hypothetical protein
MPFKDPERARAAKRAWKQRRAAMGSTVEPGRTPSAIRIEQARDVRGLLAETINAVRQEPNARTLEKARVVGFLAGVSLRAIEAGDLEARVEELEKQINGNNQATSSAEDYGPAPEVERAEGEAPEASEERDGRGDSGGGDSASIAGPAQPGGDVGPGNAA